MNHYTQIMGMFCPILIVPNIVANGNHFYTPLAVYPQFVNSQPSNLILDSAPTDVAAKIQDHKQNSEPKGQHEINNDQQNMKTQTDKNVGLSESNATKQQSNKKFEKKPKRPQTYLTQKAFYMRQKLKGKQKNGTRILRHRVKTVETKIKTSEVQKSTKKINPALRIKKKKVSIIKNAERQVKILNKIRLKLLGQCWNEFAEIPQLISGVREINNFCRLKLQNLEARQISKRLN